MKPCDDNGDDVLGTDELTSAWTWLAFWWNEIEADTVGALTRRWAREELADLTCGMTWGGEA